MPKPRTWDIWERIETGPVCPERKFDLKMLFPRAQELIKEYDIKYDPKSLIPTDDTLIDDVFKAGMDLLLDVGVLCTDTQRIIKFEESEVKETLSILPGEARLGEGTDAVVLTARKIDDRRPPTIFGGPTAAPISEKMSVKIYESYAREPIIDVLPVGTATEVEGLTIKSGSPTEVHGEVSNVGWARTALRRAGKSGMPVVGSSAVTAAGEIGTTSPEYGYRKSDMRWTWLLPELKTNYDNLCRGAHFDDYGCFTWGCNASFVGGYAGGAEGAAIACVAGELALIALYCPTVVDGITENGRYVGTSGRTEIWSSNLANAAVNKNTNIIHLGAPYITYAGPCTDMCLYEIAATTIGTTVTGCHPFGVAPNQGTGKGFLDHCTGMEARFMGEVAHAAVGIGRAEANDILKAILSRYENTIEAKDPPLGKKFEECYDPATLRPSKDYVELYLKIRKELEGLGLRFGH